MFLAIYSQYSGAQHQRDALFSKIADELKVKVLEPKITPHEMRALIWSEFEKHFAADMDLAALEEKLSNLSSYIWSLKGSINFKAFQLLLEHIDDLENYNHKEIDESNNELHQSS